MVARGARRRSLGVAWSVGVAQPACGAEPVDRADRAQRAARGHATTPRPPAVALHRRHRGRRHRRSSTTTAPTARSCCPRPWAAASRSSTSTATATRTCSSSTRTYWPWHAGGRPPRRRARALPQRRRRAVHATSPPAPGLDVAALRHGRRRRRLRQRRRRRPLRHRASAATSCFRNDGGGKFKDVTAQAGVGGDADGLEHRRAPSSTTTTTATSTSSSATTSAGRARSTSRSTTRSTASAAPTARRPTSRAPFSHLYRNDGDGTLHRRLGDGRRPGRATPPTGVPVGKALGVAPVDLDGDGWIDLVVANDTVQNFVFHNQQDGTFEEIGRGLRASPSTATATPPARWASTPPASATTTTLGIAIGNFANEMTVALRRRRASRTLLHRRGHRRGRRPAEPPAAEVRPLLLRLRPRRPARPAQRQRPPRGGDQQGPAEPALPPAGAALLERRADGDDLGAGRPERRWATCAPDRRPRLRLRRHRRRRRPRRRPDAGRRSRRCCCATTSARPPLAAREAGRQRHQPATPSAPRSSSRSTAWCSGAR